LCPLVLVVSSVAVSPVAVVVIVIIVVSAVAVLLIAVVASMLPLAIPWCLSTQCSANAQK
jgi:hypothetical protein